MTHEAAPAPGAPTPPALFSWKRFGLSAWEVILVLMAVVLPILTLLVEALTGFCSGVFFDPIPSPAHQILVALVPAANLLIWLGLRQGWSARSRLLSLLNGAGLAISFLYALIYLPLAPFALLAIVAAWWYMGVGLIGLLPLSPLLSFAAGLVFRRRLLRAYFPGQRSLPGIRIGFALGLVLLLIASSGEIATLTGLRWAASGSPETRAKGIALLRRADRNEMMLRVSHGWNTLYDETLMKWVNGGKRMDPSKARLIYFQVTGQDALQRKPRGQRGGFLFGRGRGMTEDLEWDTQQGEAVVGGILRGLTLQSSRLDGSLDGAAGTGYLEWTMVFRNDDEILQREARATVALPPGAVVSRLTLWINGEEREAAFGPRGRVKEAYQKVVRARRDPVLVTTCGPDRLLVQCFPVERRGGEMKLRLGLTVPLQPAVGTAGAWTFRLPLFLDRNFKWAEGKGHDLWIESRSVLKAGSGSALTCSAGREGVWNARGTLPEPSLWKSGASLLVEGSGDGSAWCLDTMGEKPGVVRQTLVETASEKPDSVVLVVDGSASMKAAAPGLAVALREFFPEGVRLGVIFAGDGKPERPVFRTMTRKKIDAAARAIEGFAYTGGRCNVLALEEAWDALANERGPAVIVWVHGPQPVTVNSPDGILQRFERQPGLAPIYGLQVKPGPDRVVETLESSDMIRALPPAQEPSLSLNSLFRGWRPDVRVMKALRTREEGEPGDRTGPPTSDHLARLWAKQEAAFLLATQLPVNREKAGQLAARYHLVTPVSGAVVLETEQQFREAGLEPVPANSLPTVPEPELWIVAALVLAILGWQWRRRLSAPA